jgi:hypothetical protein
VTEEAGGVTAFENVGGLEELDKCHIGDFSGLFEAIHAAIDLKVKITVSVEVSMGRVMVEDHSGDKGAVNAHELRCMEPMAKVEIRQVDGAGSASRGRKDCIDTEFESSEVTGVGGSFSDVVEAIAANGEANAVGIGFLRTKIGDNTEIGDLAIEGYIAFVYEAESVTARGKADGREAEHEARKLAGAGEFPTGTLGAGAELGVFREFAGVRVDNLETEVGGRGVRRGESEVVRWRPGWHPRRSGSGCRSGQDGAQVEQSFATWGIKGKESIGRCRGGKGGGQREEGVG